MEVPGNQKESSCPVWDPHRGERVVEVQSYETLLLETRGENGEILIVTLNRPHVLNAMNTKMMEELRQVFREQSDNDALRVVILTGAGDRAFCPGADLKERDGMTEQQWRRQHKIVEDLVLQMVDFPVPIIAAVEGWALAGGCEMALACDFIVASETARFGLKETLRGIIPGAGGLQNLPRAIGVRRAKEMVYTARDIDAQQAYAWGLVNHVVPKGKALEKALEIAEQILLSAPIAIRMAKVAMSRGPEVDFHTAYALDIAAYNVTVPTEDRLEGVAAFNEKRKPRWKNR